MKSTQVNCENNNPLHQRILSRKPAFEPDVIESVILHTFFKANPDSLAAYLFADLHVEDAIAFRARLTSRQAQLNSIATDGFPVLISRGQIMGFDSCPLCNSQN